MKKIISLFLVLLLSCSLVISVSAEEQFVYDQADLLTDSEEDALTAKLESLSHTYQSQLVVCTVASVKGGNVEGYLHDFYDHMDLGYGRNRDGVLLLVSMNPREFWTLSNGYAGAAIGNRETEAIGDAIEPYLTSGLYARAFTKFADQSARYLDRYQNGAPFDFVKNLLISLAIGVVVGLIVVLFLVKQLKTVHKQHQANVYVKQGSMNIIAQSDIYLYRTVKRTEKRSSSSSDFDGGTRTTGGRSF